MSPTAAGMAVALHVLTALALWWAAPIKNFEVPDQTIEVTMEEPPAPKAETPPPQPPATSPSPQAQPTPPPAPPQPTAHAEDECAARREAAQRALDRAPAGGRSATSAAEGSARGRAHARAGGEVAADRGAGGAAQHAGFRASRPAAAAAGHRQAPAACPADAAVCRTDGPAAPAAATCALTARPPAATATRAGQFASDGVVGQSSRCRYARPRRRRIRLGGHPQVLAIPARPAR